MRQQNVIEAFEPDPALEDLALGALAAINHETKFVVLNHER